MKKITLQKTSYLGKDELKSIIGGYVLFEKCECVLKTKNSYGKEVNLPLTDAESALIYNASSVSLCASRCEQICHSHNCSSYKATFNATGVKP